MTLRSVGKLTCTYVFFNIYRCQVPKSNFDIQPIQIIPASKYSCENLHKFIEITKLEGNLIQHGPKQNSKFSAPMVD